MTAASIKTLAEFKRFLGKPGATIQLTRHDWASHKKPDLWEPRTVAKVQTNAVKFSNNSWLYFKSSTEFRFDGGDVVSVNLSDDGSFAQMFQYRCWIAEPTS
jgi:hypothetical protein